LRRALNLLRLAPHYRREAFDAGLQAAGYRLINALADPRPGDLLLTWNRYGGQAEQAEHFERHGATVLVAENNPLGNDMLGGSYSLAQGHVALAGGTWPDGPTSRWDSWGVQLQPWRAAGGETVILAQRGIGHPNVRSPEHWAEVVRGRFGGRIRQHPGTNPAVSLADDLAGASQVITWASSAALQALVMGVPVWHAHRGFVGGWASRLLAHYPGEPRRDDAARLEVFQHLAWAIWSREEIAAGAPFVHHLAALEVPA
jgi:hypothetical protein